MDTIIPAVLLGLALTNLAVCCFRWGAGGKYQVMSSLIMTALALSMLLRDGSGGQKAALWSGAGLLVVAFMTTPGARFKRMRVELGLMAAAVAVIWALTLFELPYGATMAGLVLMAALVLAAYGVMIVRARREQSL